MELHRHILHRYGDYMSTSVHISNKRWKLVIGNLMTQVYNKLDVEHSVSLAWLNRNYQRLKTPLGGLTFSLMIALICGVLIHERCLIVSLWLAVLMFVGWFSPRAILKNAVIEIHHNQDRVVEGEKLGLTIRLNAVGQIPLIGLCIDTKLPMKSDSFEQSIDEQMTTLRIGLPVLWPWVKKTQLWSATWIATQRGIYPPVQPKLTSSFPFHLREIDKPLTNVTNFRVHPRAYPISEWPQMNHGKDDYSNIMAQTKGNSDDTISLRDFRRGDDFRRVHWPQTARTGKVIVREQQASINPRFTIHLEDAQEYHDWTLEWAVRLAASFLVGAHERGWQCDLQMGNEGSFNSRYYHYRSTQFYLDQLAGFGFEDNSSWIASNSTSVVIPRDQLHIRIESGKSESTRLTGAQKRIVLGQLPTTTADLPWLHFENENQLKHWLKIVEV